MESSETFLFGLRERVTLVPGLPCLDFSGLADRRVGLRVGGFSLGFSAGLLGFFAGLVGFLVGLVGFLVGLINLPFGLVGFLTGLVMSVDPGANVMDFFVFGLVGLLKLVGLVIAELFVTSILDELS